MTNNGIIRICEQKENGKYIECYRTENVQDIYKDLALTLISKKINGCTWVKSIKRTPLYNGFQKITVSYDNNCRDTYIVVDR